MTHTSTEQELYEQWRERYALQDEPNYSIGTDYDCKAAFIAGMQAARRAQVVKGSHVTFQAQGGDAAPVQMPEPWAISHHNRVQYSNAAWHGETPDGTKLYTDQQVRQLLAAHGVK